MSDREALYAAICAEPWADLPRLVFADWLDDHGEAGRAEFIRLQCGLAPLPMSEAARVGPANRANELLRANIGTWNTELPARPGVGWSDLYVRGFVNSATVVRPGRGLAALFTAAPLERLVLAGMRGNDLRAAVAVPEFGRLRALVLAAVRDRPLADPVQALIDSPHLGRVEYLDVEQLHLPYGELTRLLTGGGLPGTPDRPVPVAERAGAAGGGMRS